MQTKGCSDPGAEQPPLVGRTLLVLLPGRYAWPHIMARLFNQHQITPSHCAPFSSRERGLLLVPALESTTQYSFMIFLLAHPLTSAKPIRITWVSKQRPLLVLRKDIVAAAGHQDMSGWHHKGKVRYPQPIAKNDQTSVQPCRTAWPFHAYSVPIMHPIGVDMAGKHGKSMPV